MRKLSDYDVLELIVWSVLIVAVTIGCNVLAAIYDWRPGAAFWTAGTIGTVFAHVAAYRILRRAGRHVTNPDPWSLDERD